jgi:hypothetical protein
VPAAVLAAVCAMALHKNNTSKPQTADLNHLERSDML